MADISERLRVLRAEKKLSQQAVAEMAHMSLRGYRNIENGDSAPSLESIVQLADLFGVSIDYLIGRSEERR